METRPQAMHYGFISHIIIRTIFAYQSCILFLIVSNNNQFLMFIQGKTLHRIFCPSRYCESLSYSLVGVNRSRLSFVVSIVPYSILSWFHGLPHVPFNGNLVLAGIRICPFPEIPKTKQTSFLSRPKLAKYLVSQLASVATTTQSSPVAFSTLM
jgi:hypothetical protein